jgi:hypothetical protein
MDSPNPVCTAVDMQSGPNVKSSGRLKISPRRHFRRGQWVQIRSEAEIRATLDAEGKLDGLPFMPEQVEYCGRKFQVYRRADRVYLDHHYYVVRLKNTVLLDDLRCDGSAHGSCQMKCLMFWKEAWLLPAEAPKDEEKPRSTISISSLTKTKNDSERYYCQATELACIGTVLSGWDPRPYFWDIYYGERGIGEVLKLMGRQASDKFKRSFFRKPSPNQSDRVSNPIRTLLNLQPGELVEVKSYIDIKKTLSSDSRLRGLGFSPDMIPFCGKRFRVCDRIERIILEWTGELKQLHDTVALDTVHCDGSSCRACPRNCYFLWREDWLKRVEQD